jgi:5-methyltetrahydrofolate--homocysteine methyltransferase
MGKKLRLNLKGREYTNRSYLDATKERVLIFDGAMGTSLQSMNLSHDDFGGEQYFGCIDYLVLTRPDVVEGVHRSFLEVGADVIQTNSFRANKITLDDFGLGNKVFEVNQAAAQIARKMADEYSSDDQPRFVAGSIGPTGMLPSADDPDLSNITFDELVQIFAEQTTGLIRGGVDLLLIETSQDLLEVKAAIEGIQIAFEGTSQWLPIQAQVTLDTTGRMLLGTDVSAALTTLEKLPIDVVGLNCSTGPEHMRDPIRYLGENTSLPVSCIPNAGLPLNVDGEAVYPLEAEPFANDLIEFVEKNNISIVGGCCGTTPEHIKRLTDALHGAPHPIRPHLHEPKLASAIRATLMTQDPRPLLIGERINTQGSRRAKELVLAQDFDALVEIARTQIDAGAHALDVCVALTERADELNTMSTLVHTLSSSVDVPLVIDTTEPEVMEAALKSAPGRWILNSVNLESGRNKLERIFEIASAHGAAVIALTIDEDGMAISADRKFAIAKRIHNIAIQDFQLHPEDLIFDPLTFTLATGDPEYSQSAIATIEGIRSIKEKLPGTFTSLGVSNVSFGLTKSARAVLNSVMLYHCVQAGLDMAIVNPAHIKPYGEISELEQELAEDLIFNRREDALQRYIEHFEQHKSEAKVDEGVDPTDGMTAEERVHWRILHRHKIGVEDDIDEILGIHPKSERSQAAVEVLNHVLLPAMREVGDKFGAGELILPFVLQSAEVMKIAVAHVEQFLERDEGVSKGSIVLATVYGDVHDIGKNLVKTILSNNGYTVHDLGKQVPATVIIDTAIEQNADAIGLSALLVSTSRQMPLIVNELHRRGLNIPVLIGGAAINRKFGRRILITEVGDPYPGGVFYCKDAFEGLGIMDALGDPDQRTGLLEKHLNQAQLQVTAKVEVQPNEVGVRSVETTDKIPSPSTWGPRIVKDMPLEIVLQHLHKPELYRLSWGAKNLQGEEWADLEKTFNSRLEEMKREAINSGWLKPQGVYGYWPAQSEGDDLIIYDPKSASNGSLVEVSRFTFPRQKSRDKLCLADYFLPTESELMDVVAFQIVTVGKSASERVAQLEAENNYSEAYYAHGLAVQTAEATAEYLHRHIAQELGFPTSQGKRYSWGYPAIPELKDHEKVFSLLPVEDQLGMQLTSAYQLIPEQSTAAIIVHHPEAKYFSVGKSRVEQLVEGMES